MSVALMVAGCVFGFVAIMHLVRILNKWQITISGKIIPMWASFLGFIVAAILSIWMFMAGGA